MRVGVERISSNMWDPRKRIVERELIIRMFEYSARKNSAKGPPAYSTLKPETSSDSPSVRSNGARFVSARIETNHMRNRGQSGRINQVNSWEAEKEERVKAPVRKMAHNIIRAKVTSYEMVWATARRAPIRAYLEFEAQPEPKIVYTIRLETARIKRILRFRLA